MLRGLPIAAAAACLLAALGAARALDGGLSLPSDMTVEATSPAGAIVSYTATDGPGFSVLCAPPSGDTFPFGPTTVTCNSTDGTTTHTGSFHVNVVDTTKPVVTPPSDVSTTTADPGGATVSYGSASATDNIDGLLTPTCLPASGSNFPVGPTTVTCSATDAHGNTGTATFTVTVNLVDTTKPVVTVPADFSVDSENPAGTSVTFSVSATDNVDGSITPSCDHPSGSNFPLGPTTVTCSATDAHGNTGTASFTVTVTLVDHTKPVVTVPTDFSVGTENPGGTAVTFAASANDNLDGPLTPTCSPASGSNFPLGLTTVTCSATDAHGNTGTASFTVTVNLVDHTKPVVTVPSDISANSQNPGGAAVSFTVSANDNIDGPITPSCDHASGSNFPIGHTTVTCSATDAHGNTGTASFKVTVTLVDTTKPVVTVPSDMSAEADSPGGKVVTFSVSANDNIDGAITPTCNPASGSQFPLGQTTVTCSATDAHGNKGTASFHITVRDTTPPVFGAAPDLHREANSLSGSTVNYALPTAVDAVDGPVPVFCAPAPGTMFHIGTTAVHCTAQDALGHGSSAAFNIVVADTTPPTLIVPGDFSVYADTPLGANRSSSGVQEFLSLARASDAVDPHPILTNGTPPLIPVGETYITFTAVDSFGNRSTANSKLIVLPMPEPGTTPPPLPRPTDLVPPDDVGSLKARVASNSVHVSWTKPKASDFDHVDATRSTTEPGAETKLVYQGRGTSFDDNSVQNGVEYRYVVVAYDRAGNRSAGVAVVAVPQATVLLSPKGGAKIKKSAKSTTFRWLPDPHARYYNLQIYFGGERALAAGTAVKVLSAWPVRTTFALKWRWKYGGKVRTLKPGTYTWYVWPGFGDRSSADYGPLLGSSSFRVVG